MPSTAECPPPGFDRALDPLEDAGRKGMLKDFLARQRRDEVKEVGHVDPPTLLPPSAISRVAQRNPRYGVGRPAGTDDRRLGVEGDLAHLVHVDVLAHARRRSRRACRCSGACRGSGARRARGRGSTVFGPAHQGHQYRSVGLGTRMGPARWRTRRRTAPWRVVAAMSSTTSTYSQPP